MKTISLDHPVRVYFKDGECYHDSATILIANGFPSFVRGKGPDVIYPWENVKHVLRVADEVDTATTTEMGLLQAEVERSKQDAMRLGTLLTSTVAKVSFALGRAAPDSRDHDTAVDLARDIDKLRDELENAKRGWRVEHEIAENFKRDLGQAFSEVEQSKRMHLETLAKMRCALSEAIGHGNSTNADFDDLITATELLRQQWWSTRTRAIDLAKAQEEDQRSIASLTEQRDVLKRQLEELRADMRKPAATPRPSVPPPGFDINRLPKNLRMTVETAGVWGPNALFEAWRLHEEPGAEYQQTQNRDQWRATCLAYGAKDCTVYFGPGDEVTFVVELAKGHHVNDLTRALWLDHRLTANKDYNMREVRPIVDGVKPSAFKHPADNGQP